MKLFTQYNRVILLTSGIGLLFIGYFFYLTLTYFINQQVDRYLIEEQLEVRDFTNRNKLSAAHVAFKDLIITYKPIDHFTSGKIFGDTVFFNEKKGMSESARFLREDVKMSGKWYRITIIVSKVTRTEQAERITLIIVLPVLFLVGVLYIVNRLLMRKLWQPFRAILQNLKSFNLNQDQKYRSVTTQIQEFSELNQVLLSISKKITSDYNQIKLFTENASHEMTTPIAVINSKLDMMLQSYTLEEEQSRHLMDLYKATAKLNKLNQSLLLLVKLDHNLLGEKVIINLKELLEEKIGYFNELIAGKNIRVSQQLSEKEVLMSRYLSEILIDNLFSNAIRHNVDGGLISIELNEEHLVFSNSGRNEALDPDQAFNRFYKSQNSEGMGLGLAILKQIAVTHQMQLSYSFENGLHHFTLKFTA